MAVLLSRMRYRSVCQSRIWFAQLSEARGGVLFIDEAYKLGKGHVDEAALTTLVAAMSSERYAGYPRDLDEVLARNTGFESRFSTMWNFSTGKRATASSECTVVKSQLDEYTLARFATDSLRLAFEELRGLPMFMNGRDVMQIWAAVVDYRAQRVKGSPEIAKTIAYWNAGGEGRRKMRRENRRGSGSGERTKPSCRLWRKLPDRKR